METAGAYYKQFRGVPGAPGTTTDATTNWRTYLPGQTGNRSGDGVVSPGQTVISLLTASHNMLPGGNTERLTSAMCDYWDNTQFTLAPGDYPGNGTSGDSGTEQRRPSNGEAVWLSGVWESFA